MIVTDGLRPHFKLAALLGVGAMIFDTFLSGSFGWSMSIDMAAIYGLISVASGILLVIACAFWLSGHKNVGRGLVGVWAIAFGFNVVSNIGVATANRMGEVQEAQLAQAKLKGIQTIKATNTNDVEMWQRRLEELKWAPSITADMARAQLAELQAAADREAGRGGCGPKCEAIKARVMEAQKNVGAIEERANIEKQIAATKRVISQKQEELAKADTGISQAQNQSTIFGKFLKASLYATPDAADVTVANEGWGIFTALTLALLSAALTFVGAYPDLLDLKQRTANGTNMASFKPRRSEDEAASARLDMPAMTAPAMQMGFVPPQPKSQRLVAQTVQQRLAAIAAGTA